MKEAAARRRPADLRLRMPGDALTVLGAVLRMGVMAAFSALLICALPAPGAAVAADHFADASDGAAVAAGAVLYRGYCARCHGRRMEGQALWQRQDAFVHQRAPALDDSGHAWQHSDEALFQIIRSGRLAGVPEDLVSRMPPASALLDDTQILQLVAFIKARWTLGIRVSQSTLNPGFAGMPPDADSVAWKLPPNCSSALQGWRQENRQ